MANKITTPKFRVSFPHVFEPKENLSKKLKYSIVMLFEKTIDLSALKNIMREAAKEKWGDKIPKDLRMPFRDGNTKAYEGYKDMIFVSASSIQKPGLVDEMVNPIINREEFYAGCFARATVTAFAYDQMGNKGISFGLQNIQKVNDGEPLSGRDKPEDDFEAIEKSPADATDNSELFGQEGGLNDL